MAAQFVTVLIFVGPVIFGVFAGVATRGVLRERGTSSLLILLATVAVTALVIWAVQRVSSRLLPLATLLHLDLPFPGKRPSRFAVALKAGSTRNLEQLIDEQPGSDAAGGAVTILAFVAALSRHDRGTRGHSERVRALADLLGKELGLEPKERDRLRWAALLHDVGKLGVHEHVLNKTEPLNADDWVLLRRHPLEGARLVRPLQGFLGEWVDSVEQHHERWDGDGYPYGLAGEQICRGARIVAVVDTYEVLTSNIRNYRTQLSPTIAQRELARVAGSQLDPHLVSVFLGINAKQLRRAMNVAALTLQLPSLLRWRTPLRVAAPAGGDVTGEVDATPLSGVHQRHADAALPDGVGSHPDAVDLGGEEQGDVAGSHDL